MLYEAYKDVNSLILRSCALFRHMKMLPRTGF